MKTPSMKTTTSIVLLSAAILGLPLASSIAQPPPLINYQGRLVDGTNLVSGVVNMRFRLHDDPAGGSLLFESTNLVTVVDGLYATVIGQNTVSGNLTDALANPAVWLELEVDGTILSPRERILSVGYALMADGVKPEGVTEAMLAAESVSASRIASGAVGSAQLAADAVTAGKVDAATFNQTFWRAGGNAGTTPETHYLGTSDDQPLELHVNGLRVLRLEPDASSPRIIGGHSTNTAAGAGSTVGGGGNSSNPNSASAGYATVSGGLGNIALGPIATVGGGLNNTAAGSRSTVGGGEYNTASGWFSTVGGGRNNTASALYSTVGGGFNNTASGFSATIPGGRRNVATNFAFAAGHRAKANHEGAFVWSDSTNSDVASGAEDQVTFRASGGYRLYSNSGRTAGARMGAGLSSWSAVSDRNAKENFAAIDAAAILQRLADLPLSSWNYKADPERRRFIGPTAQDFHAAFDLGERTTINTLDADGVLFAAVQGLHQRNEELEIQVERVRVENEALRAELELIKSHLGL